MDDISVQRLGNELLEGDDIFGGDGVDKFQANKYCL